MSQPSEQTVIQVKKENKDLEIQLFLHEGEEKLDQMILHLKSGKCCSLHISTEYVDWSPQTRIMIMKIAKIFKELLQEKKLDNLKSLIISDSGIQRRGLAEDYQDDRYCDHTRFINFVGKEFFDITNLSLLESISIDYLTVNEFINILGSKTLKNLEVEYCNFKVEYNFKTLEETFLKSLLESLRIFGDYSDEIIQLFSKHKHLSFLGIEYNQKMSNELLRALEKSSIETFCLQAPAFDTEGLVSLLKAERIVSLEDHLHSTYSGKLNKEECEQLENAFLENTSLLLIQNDHPLFRQFTLSNPKSFSMKSEDAFEMPSLQFSYAERNAALKNATVSKEVSESIKKELIEALDSLTIALPAPLAHMIVSYGVPIRKELLTVFNSKKAEAIFPEEHSVLKKFGFYD